MLFVLRSHEKIISCKIGKNVSEEMVGEDISIFCYWILITSRLPKKLRRYKIRACLPCWYSDNHYEQDNFKNDIYITHV